MQPLKFICLFIICCWLCPAQRSEAASQPAFWQAGNLYILGSIHLGHPDFYPLNPQILQKLQQSSTLIVEVDPNAAAGDSLKPSPAKPLPAELQRQWQQALQARNLGHVSSLAIWMQVMMLTSYEFERQGYSAKLGIDQHLITEAHKRQIPLKALESLMEQLAMMSRLDPELLVEDSLQQLDSLPQTIQQMMTAWAQGDLKQLERLVLEPLQTSPPLYQALLVKRNQAWLKQLTPYIQSPKPHFMVVGSAHLLGADGLIAQLQRAGIPVKRLD